MSICHKIVKVLHEIMSLYALFASNTDSVGRWICSSTVVFLPSAIVMFMKSSYLEELEICSSFLKIWCYDFDCDCIKQIP
jgi:hypothetical protein